MVRCVATRVCLPPSQYGGQKPWKGLFDSTIYTATPRDGFHKLVSDSKEINMNSTLSYRLLYTKAKGDTMTRRNNSLTIH